MKLRVLILEDHAADAELASAQLRRAGWDVVDRRVDSESEFERVLGDFEPEVVLCDHGLMGVTAREALDRLKAIQPQTPFLVVTGAIDVVSVVDLIKGGADDVVLKSDLGRLVSSVRSALDARAKLATLSRRQIEVLLLIVAGRTTREVAEHLGLSLKTVETHRTEMMRRLDIHEVAGLVRYAVKVRLIPPES